MLGAEHEAWQLHPCWNRWTEQVSTKPFLSAVIRSPEVYAPGRAGRLELHCGGGDLHGGAAGVLPDIVVATGGKQFPALYGPSEAAVDICTSQNGWNLQASTCASSMCINDLLLLTLSFDDMMNGWSMVNLAPAQWRHCRNLGLFELPPVPARLMPPRRWWTAAFFLLMGRLLYEKWPVLIWIAGGQPSHDREARVIRRDTQLVIRGFLFWCPGGVGCCPR